MRRLTQTILLIAAFATLPACGNSSTGGNDLSSNGVEDMSFFDVDAYLYDHDGFLPDGFILPPAADGGIVIHGDGGVTYTCYIAPCQGKVYACGNCEDDDHDGLVDSLDPDCLGPCQNNEEGFIGNIPGQNNAPCKLDCYWDQDTGHGNDQCFWDHGCDPNEANPPAKTSPEIGCAYNHNTHVGGAPVPGGQNDCDYLLANQSQACHDSCGPLTPSGCDCFGCCENPNLPGTFLYVASVGSNGQPSCDATPAALANTTLCKPCEPVMGCYKACGHCQLCFGKNTLPPDCYTGDMAGGPPPQVCPPDQQPCGLAGQPLCPPATYCISGCCVPIIL